MIDLKICNPINVETEDAFRNDGTCTSAIQIWVAAGSMNLLLDIVVLILPMPSIYKIQLATYKKVTLMIAFGVGFM